MSVPRKLAHVGLVALMCALLAGTPALAADTGESDPQFTLSTDKTAYAAGDSIQETVTIETTKLLTQLTLTGNVPDGYTVEEEGVQRLEDGSWVLTIPDGDLAPVTVTLVPQDDQDDGQDDGQDDSQDDGQDDNQNDDSKDDDKPDGGKKPGDGGDSDGGQDETAPKTGDESNAALWAVLGLLSVIGVAVLVRSRKGKKVLSLLLVTAAAAGVVSMGGFRQGYAIAAGAGEENKGAALEADSRSGEEQGQVRLEQSVTVDGAEVLLTVSVDYSVAEQEADQDLSYEGYQLQWQDEFDGDSLNRDDWNVELHDPGWVNAELQAYVDSETNIYVEDGALILKANKSEDGSITSGRVNTQNKHDFTYGLFEARVKVPSGMGYLPAFWMMPTDENLYGQWPRCGEIDIMEVMGQNTKQSYGTIHYGNPHNQKQGTKTLSDDVADFSEAYHVFALEWLPGQLIWYVDGMEIYRTNDWFTTTEGQGTVTYPAPFDQPFYVILNLAVGGSWVGYPDDDAVIDGEYAIDYVRVYQKDSYDTDVQPPEKDTEIREPDETGNYVVNGDFSVQEPLDDEQDWYLGTQEGGEATAQIRDGVLELQSTQAGNQNYSIQLMQPQIPVEKGGTYRLTFDAWADAPSTVMVNVDAWQKGWTRYLPDTEFEVGTEPQSYSFEYTLTGESDPNARLEFNLGTVYFTERFYLDNVRIEKIDQQEIDDQKTVLADGNYVYNGKFQEGEDRLGYWEIDNQAGAHVFVTNEEAHDRRLKIVAPEGTSDDKPVVIRQGDLAVTGNGEYAISYDTQGDPGTTLYATLAGEALNAALTGEEQHMSASIVTQTPVDNSVVFTIVQPGTYYIDNVSIVEDSLIKNGSFNAGLVNWECFVDSSASATYTVDSLSEDNAFDVTIQNTGDADWKVQLKQENVSLVEGQCYRLSLDMKSNLDRQAVVAIQRNGNLHGDDWTPYLQETVDLTGSYQTYTFEFRMTEETDPAAVFNIAMGAVAGVQIDRQHRICVDNVVLEEIDQLTETLEPKPVGEELISNGSFADGMTSWSETIAAPAVATSTIGPEGITYAIDNPGTQDWNVQLTQFGLQLEQDCNYVLTFTALSTVDRTISVNLMSKTYEWYAGTAPALIGESQTITLPFTMTGETNTDAGLYLSLGSPINGVDQAPASVTLGSFSLKKVETLPSTEPDEPDVPADPDNLLNNADFRQGMEYWTETIANWDSSVHADAVSTTGQGGITYEIWDPGTENWHVQLKQSGIHLEAGATYQMSFRASSTVERQIMTGLQNGTTYTTYAEEIPSLTAEEQTIVFTVTMPETDSDVAFYISLGSPINGVDQPASTVVLRDLSLVKVDQPAAQEPEADQSVLSPETPEQPDQPEAAPAESGMEEPGEPQEGQAEPAQPEQPTVGEESAEQPQEEPVEMELQPDSETWTETA